MAPRTAAPRPATTASARFWRDRNGSIWSSSVGPAPTGRAPVASIVCSVIIPPVLPQLLSETGLDHLVGGIGHHRQKGGQAEVERTIFALHGRRRRIIRAVFRA